MKTSAQRLELLTRLGFFAGSMREWSEEAYRLAQVTEELGPRLELERIAEKLAAAAAAIKAVR